MFDLNAPIVPGNSVAGMTLGAAATAIIGRATSAHTVVVLAPGHIKYDFGTVAVWVRGVHIAQIGVFRGYRGLMQGGVGIGSTLSEVQAVMGTISEDDDDNLVVSGSPGWCFETEEWLAGRRPIENPSVRVTEIYVFPISTGGRQEATPRAV
jgi:hypothetical protein